MESAEQALVVIGWLAAVGVAVRWLTGRNDGGGALQATRFWDW